jgi:hypothetical protein
MSGYELQRNGDGSWSVLEKGTRLPITFKGRMQVALTEEAARSAIANLEKDHEAWWCQKAEASRPKQA